MSLQSWQGAHRILCIRLDYLGDVLMCTPAMRALKESASGRKITLLTSASGAAVGRYIPEIDECMEYSAPWMKSSLPHRPELDVEFVDTVRAGRFDAAVIFTAYSQSPLPSAMLCYLAGIPLRLAHCRENPYQLLTHWIREPEPQECIRHEVRRQLDLVAQVGCRTGDERLSFRIADADKNWAAQCLQAMGIAADKPWALLHPGATAASRRYPPQQWAEAADMLATRLRIPIVFSGGPEEVALVEGIRRSMHAGSHTLAGTLDLGKLAAVIAQAPVMVSGNTGPAHIAAATGTPIVDLYALTNPQHTPWMVPSRVLYHDVACRNCYKSICPHGHNACLARIEPAHIVQAVDDLFDKTGKERSGTVLESFNAPHSSHTSFPSPCSPSAGVASGIRA